MFTREYLLSEMASFRDLMGLKEVWNNPERMAEHFRGLLYVWARTTDATISDDILMERLCNEYDRRRSYILSRNLS